MEAAATWIPTDVRYSNKFRIPKNPKENMVFRRKLLLRAKVDPLYREKCKELFHRNILFAFNAFFYTYDPRKRPFHHQPFCTYDYEDELILELRKGIEEGYDCAVEKSRDMGVTWSVLGVFLHFWLDPFGGFDFLAGSRIEDYVDKRGDPRTHFERLRYMFYKLPKWLQPKSFNPRRDDNFAKLVNPETGAAITGESNNANFSTQGRYRGILYDEFAKWENTDEKAWTAGGDATPCRIPVSTPFGVGGQYYRIVTDGRTKVLRYHWSKHPEKALGISCIWPPPNEGDKKKLGEKWKPKVKFTSPWYEKECLRRRPSEIAQELDINYRGAGNPVFEDLAWQALEYYHAAGFQPKEWFKLDLAELKAERIPTPERTEDFEGLLGVLFPFDKEKSYVIGVDVVEGKEEGDYAVIKVVCRETKGVVATYFSRIDEVQLARVIFIVSEMYSPEPDSPDAPWTGIETIGPGLSTFNECDRLGVNNLFLAPRYDVTKGGVSYKKGFRTDTVSRNELVSGVRRWLMDTPAEVDARCVGELMSFVYSKTGKPEAKSGCHDDEVIAFGICIQVDEIAPYESMIPKKEEDIVKMIQHPEEHAPVIKEPTVEEICFQTAMRSRDLIYNAVRQEDLFDLMEIW